MISLSLRFENYQRMMEWVEGMTAARQIPAHAIARKEDTLDKFEDRYILTSSDTSLNRVPVWPGYESRERVRRMVQPKSPEPPILRDPCVVPESVLKAAGKSTVKEDK